ncbi:hypothetical protein CDV36_015849 [Fusarium kuroshium]|uniref:Major facilitator superfamily (MFS) profile domain-containing protein n=1 Tax=Fusarium kuroshium TaxID=2010991 RepID=A0A3M2R5Q5_9HYPO|nr:hypothetical protein CDV36_015849 [Fusarium kuroshium]
MADNINTWDTTGAPRPHKPTIETIENSDKMLPLGEPINSASAMDPATRARVEKRLKLKLDARCGLFVLIYIMNYLDRNNIAAARLRGLQEDLKLNDDEYATCLSILYVGYILMQVPSNIFINRIQRPSLYLAAIMLIWGLISTLSGNAHNFKGMVTIRFFLGFTEAAFLPGALLILSKWYTRRELTKRNAILFCGNLVSNAFSALVAAGVLSKMDGALGHSSWRWLFWIEGAITMAVAIAAAFILPDLPHNTKGFSREELEVAQLRIIEDVGEADVDAEGQGPFDGLYMALADPKIYIMMITFAAYVVGLSFNAFFVGTPRHAIPPHTSRHILTFDTAHSHRHAWFRLRSNPAHELAALAVLVYRFPRRCMELRSIPGEGLVGFVISMCTLSVAARYVALFLQAASYAGYIVFYSWISSTFPRPPAKRAVAIALINAFAQLGNIAGSYVWGLKDNAFRGSYGIVTAMFGATVVGALALRIVLARMNKQLKEQEEAWETQRGVAQQMRVEADEVLRMQKGFRYLL